MSLDSWTQQAAVGAATGTELSWLAVIVIAAITFYQRYLSPHKGFVCAWRVRSGRASCSEYARRVVQRCGAFALWTALPRQFERCRVACAALAARRERERDRHGRRNDRWYDHCDCSCSDLPVPSDCHSHACDVSSCDVSGCDASGCDVPLDCSF